MITKNAQETIDLAINLASKLKGGEVLALHGDLGSGKTTFTKGLAEGLHISEVITSPTFVLLKEYQILRPNVHPRGVRTGFLVHVDAYRAEKRKSLDLQKSQKDTLLNQNVAEKAQYQATLADLQKERSQISEAIYAQRRASGGITFGSSGYPYSAIDVPDPWRFLTRECTSYGAWYLNNVRGKNWYTTQPGRGSAGYWDEIAATLNAQGGNWSVSQTPRVGAVISTWS